VKPTFALDADGKVIATDGAVGALEATWPAGETVST